MQVRIYQPAKNVMQSGKNNIAWILEFVSISNKERYIEKGLGRISSNFMPQTEVRLSFNTKEEAARFAIQNNYDYEVVNPNSKRLMQKSYASNFK
jgi:ETC complex I subunit conserved region